METELTRLVDDILREEVPSLGWDYAEVIEGVTGEGDRCSVKLAGERDQVEITAPDRNVPLDVFRARVRRRMRVALEGPNPFAEPIPEDGE